MPWQPITDPGHRERPVRVAKAGADKDYVIAVDFNGQGTFD